MCPVMHARPIQYHALVPRRAARSHTHPAYALTLSRVSTRLLAPTAAPRTAPPHHTTLASHCACTHTSTACVPRALLHCARRPRRHPRAPRCNACACAARSHVIGHCSSCARFAPSCTYPSPTALIYAAVLRGVAALRGARRSAAVRAEAPCLHRPCKHARVTRTARVAASSAARRAYCGGDARGAAQQASAHCGEAQLVLSAFLPTQRNDAHRMRAHTR